MKAASHGSAQQAAGVCGPGVGGKATGQGRIGRIERGQRHGQKSARGQKQQRRQIPNTIAGRRLGPRQRGNAAGSGKRRRDDGAVGGGHEAVFPAVKGTLQLYRPVAVQAARRDCPRPTGSPGRSDSSNCGRSAARGVRTESWPASAARIFSPEPRSRPSATRPGYSTPCGRERTTVAGSSFGARFRRNRVSVRWRPEPGPCHLARCLIRATAVARLEGRFENSTGKPSHEHTSPGREPGDCGNKGHPAPEKRIV